MNSIFKTDLYQLSMVLGYIERNRHKNPVVCEGFFRSLPKNRNFLVLTGINRAIEAVRNMRFTDEHIKFLKEHPQFSHFKDEHFDVLKGFEFSGEIKAAREGTLYLPNVPFLQVKADIWETQLAETIMLSIINHSTVVSSKAARIVKATRGRDVIELGTRRTHDEGAIDAARAAYIAGTVGTSNMEAGFRYGIPTVGTMAHMWVMSYPYEGDSFEDYLIAYPNGTTLLIDTYNILQGIENGCKAARKFPDRLKAIRIDSNLFNDDGVPTGICHQARVILNKNGFRNTKIVVSDDLNEEKITALLESGEPIDVFGVGTELIESKDAPTVSGVYKITQEGGRPIAKKSENKVSLPGEHRVKREYNHRITLSFSDYVILRNEAYPKGTEELLVPEEQVLTLEEARHEALCKIESLTVAQVLSKGGHIGHVKYSDKLTRMMRSDK